MPQLQTHTHTQTRSVVHQRAELQAGVRALALKQLCSRNSAEMRDGERGSQIECVGWDGCFCWCFFQNVSL